MNKEKLVSVFKGALIAAAGAALTYVTEFVSGTDFGSFGPIVAAGLAVLVNLLRKYAVDDWEQK